MTNPMRQLSLTPALTALAKDVFSPSAKLLGSELKARLKEKFDEARENRRTQNLKVHVEAVRKTLKNAPPEETSFNQLELFHEWTEGAQDVDESCPELARMWQELLRGIIENKPVTKQLIEVMKNVDAPMAHLLLSISEQRRQLFLLPIKTLNPAWYLPTPVSGETSYHLRRLEVLGLVERDPSRIVAMILWSAAMISSFAYLKLKNTGVRVYLHSSEMSASEMRMQRTQELIQLLNYWAPYAIWAFLIAAVFIVLYNVIFKRYLCTWTGRRLADFARPNSKTT